ncbi:MAG TPA: protein kinase [Vicinamibacterales bacterium]|nr:protein kinase [Vicinamibacterales bacterium]
MTPERWQQISRVYQSALEHTPAARNAFVTEACRDDSDLRREVESLLAREHAHVLVDQPIEVAAAAVVDDDRGLQPNECLGPYRIERLIGAGGMGQVYRAVDTRLQRTVALKVLPSTLARDPQFRMRFEREAHVLASLNHSNITYVYGLEQARDAQALVMERCRAEHL